MIPTFLSWIICFTVGNQTIFQTEIYFFVFRIHVSLGLLSVGVQRNGTLTSGISNCFR